MAKNNRKQISEKVEILEILYSKIDVCFHQHFKLIDESGTGFLVSGKCHYEVTTDNIRKLSMWKKEFKAELSDLLELIANHKGSFFDTEHEKNIDSFNKKRVSDLSQNYDSLVGLIEKVHIVEI